MLSATSWLFRLDFSKPTTTLVLSSCVPTIVLWTLAQHCNWHVESHGAYTYEHHGKPGLKYTFMGSFLRLSEFCNIEKDRLGELLPLRLKFYYVYFLSNTSCSKKNSGQQMTCLLMAAINQWLLLGISNFRNCIRKACRVSFILYSTATMLVHSHNKCQLRIIMNNHLSNRPQLANGKGR
jgi:hypothetical protein